MTPHPPQPTPAPSPEPHPLSPGPFLFPPRPDFTPFYMATSSILILTAFLIVHLLGWRQHTAWFSGTPTPGSDDAFAPLTYATLYFLAWFVAPIYLLAGILYWALFTRAKKAIPPPSANP